LRAVTRERTAPPAEEAAARRERLATLEVPSATPRVGRWYSRFVAVMKVFLPMTAAGLVVMVALWQRLDEEPVPEALPEGEQGTIRLVSPQYFGTDEAGRPFRISAEQANQVPDDPTTIELAAPRAELTLSDGTRIAVSADRGRFERDGGMLLLTGNVVVDRDDGQTFRTQEASVDVNSRRAWGPARVEGTGDFGRLEAAGGFAVEGGGTSIVMKGPVRLVLDQGRAS
jgi:lipopolysaccharide export system protein LptC